MPHEIHERFTVRGTLGRGGMATVYDVTETLTDRRLALKRLRTHADLGRNQRNAELFAREFHALSQLSHPRIVRAYEYGVDEFGPYYTMELLDGGDLHQLAPLPWRTACGIARELCSALSLLHSRRLVHRDVSPRNVRRTGAGVAKLLDFGALAPFGTQKVVVGTPPCCAPESVGLQPLDGRTDLFALGATLYFMLVARHAYPAQAFAQMHAAWQQGFPRPSELVPHIPAALDQLVSELLSLAPASRPASAAEVIQRLCAIDGEPLGDELQVAAAHLALPTLVGRGQQLRRVQRRLGRAPGARGCTIVVQGAAGMGRSRFLSHCLLEATLLGTTVVRADADDARSGDYGTWRAIMAQLLRVLPTAALQTAAPHREALAQIAPELFPGAAPEAPLPRPQLQAAVSGWLAALAEHARLVIAVDDVERSDEPSAALFSLLAHDGLPGLCLLASVPDSPLASFGAPVRMLLEVGTRVRLEALSRADSENLLKSLFGEVRNVGVLAHRLHELAAGNPRDLLQLAQHLVSQNLVRFEAGTWNLPQRIETTELPSSLAQALHARVAALEPSARELACALALCPDLSFNLDECSRLCQRQDKSALLTEIAQLVEAEIVFEFEEQVRLDRPLWVAPLRAAAGRAEARSLHARMARVMEARGQEFRASQHWLRAGEHTRALDVLVAHAAVSQEQTAQSAELFANYAYSLPDDWYDTYCEALRLCAMLQRPRRDAMILRGRVSGLLPAFTIDDTAELEQLHAQLTSDSGLLDWAELDPALEPRARITLAQQRAQARYDATPEHERVFEPARALRLLARAVISSTARVANGLDVAYLRSLPRLEPFAEASASVAATHDLVLGMEARYTGHTERAQAIYLDLLARVGRPDRAGIEGSYAEIIALAIMNAIGMMDACRGQPSALFWAARVSEHASYRVNAEHTRMVHHLFQGDLASANHCHKQLERLRLQSQPLYARAHAVWEIDAYTMAEDLTMVRYAGEHSARLAESYEAWRAVHEYARAEYQRIRGDYVGALACIERALELARPGEHMLWASMAHTRVRALNGLGRSAEALAEAEGYVELSDLYELLSVAEPLRLALGICQAQCGKVEARQTVAAVLDRYHTQGIDGLCLGFAHEAGARVALALGDSQGFQAHAEQCRAIYCRYDNPALLVKYQRLLREAAGKPRAHPADLARLDDDSSDLAARLWLAFEHCVNDRQRAELALQTLLHQSRALGGVLFALAQGRPEVAAASGEEMPEPLLLDWVDAYIEAHVQDAATSTGAREQPSEESYERVYEYGDRQYRLVLLNHGLGGHSIITAVAVLALASGAQFQYPGPIANLMSRLWAERAEVPTLALQAKPA